jgi:hypothetical protein
MEPSIQRILLSDRELPLRGGSDLATRARLLLRQQKETWALLRTGYAGLQDVRTRTIMLEGCSLRVQWNPARIVSSSANLDAESISRRKCFLCAANLPEGQRGILFAGSYLVLCNPFPIFAEHFTIPHTSHTDQRIGPSFATMLDLAHAMQKRYLVSYNGPRSGASAPDHLHFQAGEKGFLPIESELGALEAEGRVLSDTKTMRVVATEGGLRRFIVLRAAERAPLVGALGALESALGGTTGEKEEPMMNILAWYDSGAWTVVVFPRAKHRPSAYFAQGEEKILISPAALDCGGVLTTPLEKDFNRLTEENVRVMFGEIFLAGDVFHRVCENLAVDLSPR